MEMLLAVGQAKRAIQWAQALEPHLHDDVALRLFDTRGCAYAEEAVTHLPGTKATK